jgi:hypothetical protein
LTGEANADIQVDRRLGLDAALARGFAGAVAGFEASIASRASLSRAVFESRLFASASMRALAVLSVISDFVSALDGVGRNRVCCVMGLLMLSVSRCSEKAKRPGEPGLSNAPQ